MNLDHLLFKFTATKITIVFSVLAVVVLLITTSKNTIGLTPDSISYIEIAKNISAGNGIVNSQGDVVTTWPPLYPATISVISNVFSLNMIASAKLLSTFSILLLVVLFNLILKRIHVNNSRNLILLNALFFLAPALHSYLLMWSETLFLVILFSITYLLILYLNCRKALYLLAIGILLSLLVLTRYAGLGFVAGVGFYLLFFDTEPFKKRIGNCLYFSIPFLIVLGSWLFYLETLQVEEVTKRTLSFHLTSWAQFEDFIYVFSYWLFPFGRLKSYLLTLIFIIALFFLKALSTQKLKSIFKNNSPLKLFAIMAITYVAFLFTSNIFFDATTTMEQRMISPIFMFVLVIVYFYFKSVYLKSNYKRILTLMLSFVFVVQSYCFARYHYRFYNNGIGFSSEEWMTSETVSKLPQLKAGKIYTNGNDVFTFFHNNKNQNIHKLPKNVVQIKGTASSTYQDELQAMFEDIKTNDAIIVYFTNINWRDYYPSPEELLVYKEDFTIEEFEDGFIIKN